MGAWDICAGALDGGRGRSSVLERWGDTKRYKEMRYSLEVIGIRVVGGAGVQVIRQAGCGGNRPLLHSLEVRQIVVSKRFLLVQVAMR
jgi:hypothetical protein